MKLGVNVLDFGPGTSPDVLGRLSDGAACAERVRPDDDGDRLAVASDGHLFAGENAVQDLWERRPSLAG